MWLRCRGCQSSSSSSGSSSSDGVRNLPPTATLSTTDSVNSCSSLRHVSEFGSLSIIDYDKYLTEGVLFEIFQRLPFKSLFKFRCVSKKWLSLLSNPVVMNRNLDSMTPSRPWALFFNLNRPAAELVSFASLDHYQFISDHDGFIFRFLYSAISPYKEERLYLLASSNGLVLCSKSTAFQSKYYVCNPFTRKWVSLPPPPQTPRAWVLNGIICESSSPTLTSTTYKVVRIKECRQPPKTSFDLDIFSSDIGEWSTYQISCPQEITMLYPFLSCVVSHNGSLYWIEGQNRIIAYDLINNNNNNKNGGCQCRLIDLPDLGIGDYYGYLSELEGSISYSRCQNGELSVWVLEDYLHRRWVWRLVHKIEINDILTENSVGRRLKEFIERKSSTPLAYINLQPLAFDPVDPDVLILAFDVAHFFGYNTRTRSLKRFRQNCHSRCSLAGEGFPFVFIPRSTTLPPPTWSDS